VGAVGDQDLVALVLLVLLVVRADEEQAGELALRAAAGWSVTASIPRSP